MVVDSYLITLVWKDGPPLLISPMPARTFLEERDAGATAHEVRAVDELLH